MKSEFLKLKKVDFWKGMIVAGFSTAVSTIGTWATIIIESQSFEWSWITLAKAAGVGFIGGFSGYISKNLFSNSDGEPFKKEQ
jgi:hypothetical protein